MLVHDRFHAHECAGPSVALAAREASWLRGVVNGLGRTAPKELLGPLRKPGLDGANSSSSRIKVGQKNRFLREKRWQSVDSNRRHGQAAGMSACGYRALGWPLALVAAAFCVAPGCSLATNTDSLTGVDGGGTEEAGADSAVPGDGAPASDTGAGDGAVDAKADGGSDAEAGPSTATSCRALHDQGQAMSGKYTLQGPSGPFDAYCDMVSFGGGWTLVTPQMIATREQSKDLDSASPATLAVDESTDSNGGVKFDVQVTANNCGAVMTALRPVHKFTVNELDDWKSIMASYSFSGDAGCWSAFGDATTDPKAVDSNLLPFSSAFDHADNSVNISRSTDGSAIPFDGRTAVCTSNADNFWAPVYDTAAKSVRLTLRRRTAGQVAGIQITADCGMPAWSISSIYVR